MRRGGGIRERIVGTEGGCGFEGVEVAKTWKVQERSWSPSWTYWSMGKVTEILFSLVSDAMGKERVTTCSPTARPRGSAGKLAINKQHSLFSSASPRSSSAA